MVVACGEMKKYTGLQFGVRNTFSEPQNWYLSSRVEQGNLNSMDLIICFSSWSSNRGYTLAYFPLSEPQNYFLRIKIKLQEPIVLFSVLSENYSRQSMFNQNLCPFHSGIQKCRIIKAKLWIKNNFPQYALHTIAPIHVQVEISFCFLNEHFSLKGFL